jgi:uncharacterized protein
MAVVVRFPGVKVQEMPSGARVITGVATSTTAFIGRTQRGPDDTPVTVNSFGEFERIFGGLWLASTLGFAVRDFFLNGGARAIIVRLYNPEMGPHARPARSVITVGELKLEAAGKGAWGMRLRAAIDLEVSGDVAAGMGLAEEDIFNLTLQELDAAGNVLTQELFRNVSIKDGPRRIDRALAAGSALARWNGSWPPDPLPTVTAAADDEVTKAAKAFQAAKAANPQVPADIAVAQTALDNACIAAEASDGLPLTRNDNFISADAAANTKGLFALDGADLFNLLCIPPYTAAGDVEVSLVSDAAAYCEQRRAMLLVDPPSDWKDAGTARAKFTDATQDFVGTRSRNAALFYPRLRMPNPLRDNQVEDFAPCGAVAGVFARTDASQGVWKAPAGLDASLNGVPQLSVSLTNAENGSLNQLGINCLRSLPSAGPVVWGSRTLHGADQLADEYQYVPVRRTALYIENSLFRGLQWAVFEPNEEPLWAQIRLSAGAFMHSLFRQGALQGNTPHDAYFVKCDSETTTRSDINLGVVNIIVGFAPLKPAEFVILQIQQMAGQTAS